MVKTGRGIERNNKDLCSIGEEHFGPVKSKLYALTSPWRKKLVDLVVDDIESTHPQRILDIGCGPGDVLEKLREPGVELYGIDPSPYMLSIAKDKLKKINCQQNARVHLAVGSNRQIPFNMKFDRIFTSISFHHWKDREKNIPRILTMLEQKGEFTIYEYDRDQIPILQRTLARTHVVSANELKHLEFKGYTKQIEHTKPFIIIRFKKD